MLFIVKKNKKKQYSQKKGTMKHVRQNIGTVKRHKPKANGNGCSM